MKDMASNQTIFVSTIQILYQSLTLTIHNSIKLIWLSYITCNIISNFFIFHLISLHPNLVYILFCINIRVRLTSVPGTS